MIEVIRCGHDSRHTKPVDVVHEKGLDHHLLLLIKAEAYVETEEGVVFVRPGTGVLFDKNVRIHYGCGEKNYNDDWIHFSVSPNDRILEEAKIPVGIPLQLLAFSDLCQYVRLLVAEKYLQTSGSRAIEDALMHAFLLKFGEQREEEIPSLNRYYPSMSRLREEVINAPGRKWEIEKMAKKLNVSVSYFQHLYKEMFGIPFRKDVILARLSSSCFYLKETDMDITSVASFCGYESDLHFMRQFKKFQGMTPSQYRIWARGQRREKRGIQS